MRIKQMVNCYRTMMSILKSKESEETSNTPTSCSDAVPQPSLKLMPQNPEMTTDQFLLLLILTTQCSRPCGDQIQRAQHARTEIFFPPTVQENSLLNSVRNIFGHPPSCEPSPPAGRPSQSALSNGRREPQSCCLNTQNRQTRI